MATIRVHHLAYNSLTDGPGCRTSVYLQGCSIRCPGCHNQSMWNHQGGEAWDTAILAHTILDQQAPVTILGGEPFDQIEALAALVYGLTHYDPEYVPHIIIYTGYVFIDLLDRVLAHEQSQHFLTIWDQINVLVDGPFLPRQDDDFVQYRGSRNQRVIDVHATKQHAALVYLDWDTPELSITDDGAVVGARGVIQLLQTASHAIPSCGKN